MATEFAGAMPVIEKTLDWLEELEALGSGRDYELAVNVLEDHGVAIKQDLWSKQMEKMMVLSTAHVTHETRVRLDNENFDGLVAYDKAEFGWWIAIVEDELDPTQLPDDLRQVLIYAKKFGCAWVMLDCDADTIDDLPTYFGK
jgi:hypothetical protein